MNSKIIGYLLILASCIYPLRIINNNILSPKVAIYGVDGVIISRGMMIIYINFIVAKIGFHILKQDDVK